jgi:hypothetical protein
MLINRESYFATDLALSVEIHPDKCSSIKRELNTLGTSLSSFDLQEYPKGQVK